MNNPLCMAVPGLDPEIDPANQTDLRHWITGSRPVMESFVL